MPQIVSDSGLPAHERSGATGFKHLPWIQVAVKFDELPNQPRPTGLMAGPDACPVISVKVLVEKKVILPVGIGLELLRTPVYWAPIALVTQKDALQAGRDFPTHLEEVHQVA